MKDTLSPMQQEILNRADAIFASIGTAVGKATEFAGEQLPDIATQYILYNRVYLTSIVVTAILVFVAQQVITLNIVLKIIREGKASGKWFDSGEYWLVYCVITFITAIPTSTFFLANFSNCLKVWFAPKIFLIEQVVHLAKSLH